MVLIEEHDLKLLVLLQNDLARLSPLSLVEALFGCHIIEAACPS